MSALLSSVAHGQRFKLAPPFISDGGHSWTAHLPPHLQADSHEAPFVSRLCLYENGQRLPHGHALHRSVRALGGGLHSHSAGRLRFSTTDNSNPNLNGRLYEFDLSLTLPQWRNALLATLCGLWSLHPASAYLRERGGDKVPPPLFCSIGLTNKCNLRCEICGSQKFLDESGARRRHMKFDLFQAAADVLFPCLAEVELNSQGDPLLYPDIARVIRQIHDHRCDIKVQTNGTLFTPKVIDALTACTGTVNLSLDAVGPAFDLVRRGGVWQKAEPGLLQFLRARDPRRMAVGLYPTITQRTLPHALEVVDWAAEHDIDEVSFHRYIPIQNSFEVAPDATELAALADRIADRIATSRIGTRILLDGKVLQERASGQRRTTFAHETKQEIARLARPAMFPMEPSPYADPLKICVAPDHYVEIGLDGQIGACCRAQDVTLGYATSVESFADAWFGRNYAAIRHSLGRDLTTPFPLPNCAGCIEAFAPSSLNGRRAADHDKAAEELDYSDWNEFTFEAIRKERGHCFLAMLPPGFALDDYELFEDDARLGPLDVLHEEIRQRGAGRTSFWGRQVYFSASDNSDPRYNDRRYVLRRKSG